MLFNSIEYIQLLLVTVFLYWMTPYVLARQIIIFTACVMFYITWSPILIWLLIGMVLIHWLLALKLTGKNSKLIITFLVTASLATLTYYKYTNFFLQIISQIADQIGSDLEVSKSSIILPLGISFYTFQIIAYSLDVYRKRIEPEKNPFLLCLFIMFFPQLIAGPICRTVELMPQLKAKQTPKPDNFIDGFFVFLTGFFLKVCIADNISPYVNVIFSNPEMYSGYDNLLGAVGFGIQIYGDFCGYSLMALGSAQLFGYKLPFNFNTPYVSTTIQEFWRRWHLTLSSWLKDYLYISLGGNRHGTIMTYRNLLITMILGGLWHGANWTFIVWGTIHGSALAVERWFMSWRKGTALDLSNKKSLAKIFGYAWTMTTVYIAWIYFRADNVFLANTQITKILTPQAGWLKSVVDIKYYETTALFMIFHTPLHRLTFTKPMSQRGLKTNLFFFPLLILMSIIYYVDSEDFIYFQF